MWWCVQPIRKWHDDDDDESINNELTNDGNLEYVDDSYEPFEDPIWGNHIDENEDNSNYIQMLFQNIYGCCFKNVCG